MKELPGFWLDCPQQRHKMEQKHQSSTLIIVYSSTAPTEGLIPVRKRLQWKIWVKGVLVSSPALHRGGPYQDELHPGFIEGQPGIQIHTFKLAHTGSWTSLPHVNTDKRQRSANCSGKMDRCVMIQQSGSSQSDERREQSGGSVSLLLSVPRSDIRHLLPVWNGAHHRSEIRKHEMHKSSGVTEKVFFF